MTNVHLPVRAIINDEVLFQDMGEECVLLNLANETYYGLDDVGARIWQALTETSDTEAIVGKLRAYYAVSEETLRQDLANLLAGLQSAGLARCEYNLDSETVR